MDPCTWISWPAFCLLPPDGTRRNRNQTFTSRWRWLSENRRAVCLRLGSHSSARGELCPLASSHSGMRNISKGGVSEKTWAFSGSTWHIRQAPEETVQHRFASELPEGFDAIDTCWTRSRKSQCKKNNERSTELFFLVPLVIYSRLFSNQTSARAAQPHPLHRQAEFQQLAMRTSRPKVLSHSPSPSLAVQSGALFDKPKPRLESTRHRTTRPNGSCFTVFGGACFQKQV